MKLTIFTPTYNRAYIINTLYESLKRQSVIDFEWLVIDDGSTDNTEDVFKTILETTTLDVKYIKKRNGGKHTAANLALEHALGELFFVVDSDDYLADNAVERILFYYNQIKNDESFCGICGQKSFFNGENIGSDINYDILDTTIIDYRFYKKISGDKADVFKTKLLKEHRFPEYPGEKWCPLSIVWNRFGSNLKVRYFNEVLYYAEYLEDGLSLNRLKTRKNSPNNTMQYYLEISQYDIPIKEKIKAKINYWRFSFYSKRKFSKKFFESKPSFRFTSLVLGYFLYQFDKNAKIHDKLLNPNSKLINQQKSS